MLTGCAGVCDVDGDAGDDGGLGAAVRPGTYAAAGSRHHDCKHQPDAVLPAAIGTADNSATGREGEAPEITITAGCDLRSTAPSAAGHASAACHCYATHFVPDWYL
jgi:hypothetical protein